MVLGSRDSSSWQRRLRGLSPKTLRLVLGLGIGGVVLLLLSAWLGAPPAASSLGAAGGSTAIRSPSASETGSPLSSGGGGGGGNSPAGAAPASSQAGASSQDTALGAASPLTAYEASLSAALTQVLSHVSGAGQVTSAVTVARTPKTVLAENGTVVRDAQTGSGSDTTQMSQEMALALSQGKTIPTSVVGAPVTGVLVVATGASDPIVRAELTQGTEALFGLMANQVMVLP